MRRAIGIDESGMKNIIEELRVSNLEELRVSKLEESH